MTDDETIILEGCEKFRNVQSVIICYWTIEGTDITFEQFNDIEK